MNKTVNNNNSIENLMIKGKGKRMLTNPKNNNNNIQKKHKGIIFKENNSLNNVNEDIRKKVTYNENSINESSKNIIKNIEINKIFFYFCCLFVKRRKNIENILFEEGIKLFSNKMNVIDIFRNLTKADETKNFSKMIEMNDSCKEIINKFEII